MPPHHEYRSVSACSSFKYFLESFFPFVGLPAYSRPPIVFGIPGLFLLKNQAFRSGLVIIVKDGALFLWLTYYQAFQTTVQSNPPILNKFQTLLSPLHYTYTIQALLFVSLSTTSISLASSLHTFPAQPNHNRCRCLCPLHHLPSATISTHPYRLFNPFEISSP